MSTVRIPQDVYEALRAHAVSERRTLTAQLEHMLRAHPAITDILALHAKGGDAQAPDVSIRGLRRPL
jgi:hypothetical protein